MIYPHTTLLQNTIINWIGGKYMILKCLQAQNVHIVFSFLKIISENSKLRLIIDN